MRFRFLHLSGLPLLCVEVRSLSPGNTQRSCLLQAVHSRFPQEWVPIITLTNNFFALVPLDLLHPSAICAFLSTDPLELQLAAHCEAYSGNASENFLHAAFQGIHIVSFQGTSWEPAPDAPFWLNRAIEELNKDQGTREMVQSLLSDTCPHLVSGLLEAGKSELEQQGRPAGLRPFSTPGLYLGFSTRGFPKGIYSFSQQSLSVTACTS